MDLEQFVQQSLVQIVRGVQAANKELKGAADNTKPNPFILSYSGGDNPKSPHVTFDVAITSKSERKSGGGASAKIWVVEARGGLVDRHAHETVSRVQFSVVVAEYQGAPSSGSPTRTT